MNNKRVRNIELILWSKEELDRCIDIVETEYIDYAYILHDKDIDDEGKIKKPHYHFRVFAVYQRTITAWATFFKVMPNDIQILENKRRSIRYLIHMDSPKKYQYSLLDVVTNIVDIDYYFNEDKSSEDTQLQNIFGYISAIQTYIYFREIKDYVLQNNYWGAYRRYYSIIKDVIIEHNRYCTDYLLDYNEKL